MRRALVIAVVLCLNAPMLAQSRAPEVVRIPSDGAVMFGSMFAADASRRRPTVILLHGHPGTLVTAAGAESNVLGLAQPLQRAGFSVLTFNYRGAWGSGGAYGLVARIDDVKATIAFARSDAGARYGIDPGRLVVVGHSAGGFNALAASVDDTGITCTVAIAPANYGAELLRRFQQRPPSATVDEPIVGLGGYTGRDLRREVAAHQARLDLRSRMARLKGRPVLIVQGRQDETVPAEEMAPYIEGAQAAGASPFDRLFMDANHNYTRPGNRAELATVVVNWLTKHCV